jgi:hypothetical protein
MFCKSDEVDRVRLAFGCRRKSCFVPTAIEMSVSELTETRAIYIPSPAAEPPDGAATMSDGTSATSLQAWRWETPAAAQLAADGKDVVRTAARRQSHDACATTTPNRRVVRQGKRQERAHPLADDADISSVVELFVSYCSRQQLAADKFFHYRSSCEFSIKLKHS